MSVFSKKDIFYMQQALELADAAKGKTFPNPAVGAVIVSNGRIIGRGATQVYGGPHAEKVALKEAGDKAMGATLYVTLEPCCHHGRTPPCTDAIIAAGIRKIFLSVKDPNPLVAGRGIKQLRKNGISVSTGLLRKEATMLNEDFFFSIQSKRAWVTLKMALTLDGLISDGAGGSKWITAEDSRGWVQELRRYHAAIAVGKTTLLSDDPQLTVRHKTGYNPARIVFASSKNIPENTFFVQNCNQTRSIVVLPGGISKNISKEAGIEYWYTGQTESKNHLIAFLEMAFEEKITSILIEGGQKMASQFLESHLVNRVHLFYAPKILGAGKGGICFEQGLAINRSIILDNVTHTVFGTDMLISGTPVYPSE